MDKKLKGKLIEMAENAKAVADKEKEIKELNKKEDDLRRQAEKMQKDIFDSPIVVNGVLFNNQHIGGFTLFNSRLVAFIVEAD